MFCLFIFHVLEKVLHPHRHQHNTSLLYHYLICCYKKHLCVCSRNLHFQINLEAIRSSRRTETFNLLCCVLNLFYFIFPFLFTKFNFHKYDAPSLKFITNRSAFSLFCFLKLFFSPLRLVKLFFRVFSWIIKSFFACEYINFFSLLLRLNTFKSAEWRKKNLKCESIAIESLFLLFAPRRFLETVTRRSAKDYYINISFLIVAHDVASDWIFCTENEQK